MPTRLDVIVKASALLAAAALVDAVLRRRGSAATRYLVWSLTMAALLVLPIASSVLPPWHVRIPVARARRRRTPPVGRSPARRRRRARRRIAAEAGHDRQPLQPTLAAGRPVSCADRSPSLSSTPPAPPAPPARSAASRSCSGA